jgi:hypothetical protein
VKIGISLLSQAESQFTGTARYVSELLRELAALDGEVKIEVLCNELAVESAMNWAARNVDVRRVDNFRLGHSRRSRVVAITLGLLHSGPLASQFSPDVQAVEYPLIISLPRIQLPTLVYHHDLLHRAHPELFHGRSSGGGGFRMTYRHAARHSFSRPINTRRRRSWNSSGLSPSA